MASTFGWTLNYIYQVNLYELGYIIDGASKTIDKQNKAAKKQGSSRSGKVEMDSLSQLQNLPGMKVVRSKSGSR